METEDERARLENDAATKRLRLVMETEEERKAKLVKMVATTQLRLALGENQSSNSVGTDSKSKCNCFSAFISL